MRRVLAVLLAALPLVGCISLGSGAPPTEGIRLATPTDKPTEPPTRAPPVVTPDLNDSGYVMTASWRVGDAWDYLSNQSGYRTVRVLEEVHAPGRRLVLIEETGGVYRSEVPIWRARVWADGDTLTRYNLTYIGGLGTIRYEPGNFSARYFRNGSFEYNETVLRAGTPIEQATVRANSHFVGFVTLKLVGGTTTVGKVEHRILRTSDTGNSTREYVERYPSNEFGNDARFIVGRGEVFILTGYRYGGVTKGVLHEW